MPESGSRPAARILVVRLGAMGDILHALPAVHTLRRTFPAGRITWVVESKWLPLLQGSGLVDRLIPFHRREPSSWIATRRELRTEHYDFAIDFQGLIKSALVAWLARPGRIFGDSAAREKPAAILYSDRVSIFSDHVVDRACELAVAAGAMDGPREFLLPQGVPEGKLPDTPFVLASPLAGWVSKQWPLEYYQQLAAILSARFGLRLVLNGAPGTVPAIPGTIAHQSGIAGLIHATRQATAVVGVDSGPLHLAAALGKPGVAIFGPTDPLRNGPFGGTIKVLRAPGCATSMRRGNLIDPSMRAITPELLIPALAERLAASKCHA